MQAGFLTFPASQYLPGSRTTSGFVDCKTFAQRVGNGITATGIVPDFHRIPSRILPEAECSPESATKVVNVFLIECKFIPENYTHNHLFL